MVTDVAKQVLHLEIRGIVQGVSYRWSMVEQATALGVTGWVRNRSDGSVEAMISGDSDALQKLVDWSRSGPVGAHVERVDISAGEGYFESFEQRRTD